MICTTIQYFFGISWIWNIYIHIYIHVFAWHVSKHQWFVNLEVQVYWMLGFLKVWLPQNSCGITSTFDVVWNKTLVIYICMKGMNKPPFQKNKGTMHTLRHGYASLCILIHNETIRSIRISSSINRPCLPRPPAHPPQRLAHPPLLLPPPRSRGVCVWMVWERGKRSPLINGPHLVVPLIEGPPHLWL